MSRSLRRVGMPCRYVVPRLEALRGEARAGPRAYLSYLPRAGSRTSPMINQMKTMENQMETMKLTLDKVAAVNLKQEEEVGESLEEVLSEKISTATMMHDLETRLKEDGEFQTEKEDESIFITWPRQNEVPGRLEKLKAMQLLWVKEIPPKSQQRS
ncbi:unnamed protein product [Mytilus edulis]|uniref:Uncharacterized protein n=1 Tax=Mytilus edulis TaxID=6550 RepID=A0A8S3QTK1_MYTED|nr:unnamed protein product [Mytilus edulis]